MKPIIGITVDGERDASNRRTEGKLTLNWNYPQVVADFGGVPVLIPPMAAMDAVVEILDGWLIPGGMDLDPARWGDPVHAEARLIAPDRPNGEFDLMRRIPAELPVLGICYGCQLINVARGGDLHQHLNDLLGHGDHSSGGIDSYTVVADSHLGKALQSTAIRGKSYHHQGIRKVGDHLSVVAQNAEGIVEAVEATDRPWMVGVQWHPERTADDPTTQNLFRAFIEQAAQFRARRTR